VSSSSRSPELDKLPFIADILPPDIRAELETLNAPLDELTGLYRWFIRPGKVPPRAAAHRRIEFGAAARDRGNISRGCQPRPHDLPFNVHILKRNCNGSWHRAV
jgi:hypothetical protein